MNVISSNLRTASRWAAGLTLVALLAACASKERVILLPQADGGASAVSVKTAQGEVLLDKPYAGAAVAKDGNVKAVEFKKDEVDKRYGELFARQPTAPKRFVLYFEAGGVTLTPESQAQLPDVIKEYKGRAGGEMIVTGHTDAAGSTQSNDALSLQRAQAIRDLLLTQGGDAKRVAAAGRGKRELLVPTADGVDEPKNRRVEISVR